MGAPLQAALILVGAGTNGDAHAAATVENGPPAPENGPAAPAYSRGGVAAGTPAAFVSNAVFANVVEEPFPAQLPAKTMPRMCKYKGPRGACTATHQQRSPFCGRHTCSKCDGCKASSDMFCGGDACAQPFHAPTAAANDVDEAIGQVRLTALWHGVSVRASCAEESVC